MEALEPLAKAILDTRAAWLYATLAELYDPDLMLPNLRAAHQVAGPGGRPAVTGGGGFSSERECVERLFARYEKMHAPLGSG